MCLTNGVPEVRSTQPFCIFIRNFAKDTLVIPKDMIVGSVSKIPLSMTEVIGDFGHEIAKCLNIMDATSATIQIEREASKIQGISWEEQALGGEIQKTVPLQSE